MGTMMQNPEILIAEDDPDDRLLIADAFEEVYPDKPVGFVKDGAELLDYLRRKGNYSHLKNNFLPGLVLLDLNMPIMDGRKALKAIKQDPDLRRVPVVVLTTSRADDDVFHVHDLGVNSYISKPVTYERLVEVVKSISDYWLQVATLPVQ